MLSMRDKPLGHLERNAKPLDRPSSTTYYYFTVVPDNLLRLKNLGHDVSAELTKQWWQSYRSGAVYYGRHTLDKI